MNKHQQILSELKSYVSLKSEFDFMNIYKGVPLVYKGELQHIIDDAAVFVFQSPDSICLTWSETTHIIDNRLLSGIKARVLDFDVQSGLATLGDFDYAERSFGDRIMVRVGTQEPIPTQVKWEKNLFDGAIVDVSLTGFGIQLDLPKEQIPTKNSRVNLKFQILEREIEIPAKVKAIFEDDDCYRLATYFEDTNPGYATIAQYITRRRVDLRQEIQDKYDLAMQ